MKLLIFILVTYFTILFLPMSSIAIEGLPGANWVSLNDDVDGLTGSGGMGWVKQGVDWTTLPGDINFNTYVEYGLRARNKKETYFNAQGPAVGLEFSKSYFSAGIDYYWVDFPKQNLQDEGYEYTLGWYYSKDIEPLIGDTFAEGFPFSTWGKLSYDASGPTGSGSMGWIQQGIDWFTIPGDITVNTFLKYSYRGREKNNEYYDAQGPSIGIEFTKSFFSFGVSRYWEEFPVLNISQETTQFFAGWYYTWDLMNKD